jgi:N6-adenosine-specific RNA methylase IME4
MPHGRQTKLIHFATVKISAIKVGKRFRADVGDLRSLADSIATLGLLHPVVIDGKARLVAGARRLAAVRLLGWRDVPVRIVRTLTDAADALRAERDENTERKQFRPSEIVALARALEPLERAEAKARQRHGGRPKNGEAKTGGKIPHQSTGKTRERLGRAVGVSGRTLDKASAVVDAAQAEPDKYGGLLRQMDRTANIHGAYRILLKRQEAERIDAAPPPLPTGPFNVIVCDPPWRYTVRVDDLTRFGKTPYPDMSVEDICALPVKKLAAEDCVLWLWTTNSFWRESFAVLDAWGFTEKTVLTWAKARTGCGKWLLGRTEHCILSVRGKPTVLLSNQSTLLVAPTTGTHSEKPDEFYRMVESLCPGSKVELFARRARPGWVSHGNAVAGAGTQDVRFAPVAKAGGRVTKAGQKNRRSRRAVA